MKQFPLCLPGYSQGSDLSWNQPSEELIPLAVLLQGMLSGAACIGSTVYQAAVFCLKIMEGFGLEESIKVIWFHPPALGCSVKSDILIGCCKFWRNVKHINFPFSTSTTSSSSFLPTFCQPGKHPAVWCHALHYGNYTAVGSGAQWLCLVRVHVAKGMGFYLN